MAYYGKYGHGLQTFAREWGLDRMKSEELDPIVFDALQSFVDIISPERGYRLSFVDKGTAATSFATKRITCTSEALRGLHLANTYSWEAGHDKGKASRGTMARVEKGLRFYITAGMLCHEVSHIRYGQDTAGAVERKYGKSKNYALAQRISNILDENRIEAAFAYDFPGFADVFPRVLEWVARKQNGGDPRRVIQKVTNRMEALDAALMGSRFYKFTHTYDATAKQCIDFGRAWDKKYTRDDTVRLHLAGVAAMIEWLKQFPAPPREDEPEPPICKPPVGPPPQDDEDEDDEPEDGPDPIDFGDEDDEDEDEQEGPTGRGPKSDDDEDDDESDEDGESDDESDEDDEDDGWGSEDEDESDEDDDESASGGNDDDNLDDIEPVEEAEDEAPVLNEDEVNKATQNIPDTDGATKSQNTPQDTRTENEMNKVLGEIEVIPATESGAQVRITRHPKKRNGVGTIPKGDAAIAHEVRLAFESTRYAHDEWASGYSTGRFRSRDAARAASGDLNVFSHRVSESSTRVHLAMLVDYSGSMSGDRFDQACALAQTLVDAMDGSQVYRQSVWQYLSGGYSYSNGEYISSVELNRLWQTGDTKAIRDALIDGGPADSGTPTGPALYALGHEVLADRKVDEAMIILSITDGDPDDKGQVVHAVQYWADKGVTFIGVNVGAVWSDAWVKANPERAKIALLNAKNKMEAQYGEGRSIEFDGSWKHLAEDIGAVVGRALAGTIDK